MPRKKIVKKTRKSKEVPMKFVGGMISLIDKMTYHFPEGFTWCWTWSMFGKAKTLQGFNADGTLCFEAPAGMVSCVSGPTYTTPLRG